MASAANMEETIDSVLRQGLFPDAARKNQKVILLNVIYGRMRLEEAAEALGTDVVILRNMLERISNSAPRGLEMESAEDEEQELGVGAVEVQDEAEEEQNGIPELSTPSPLLGPMEDSPTRGSDADENALPEPSKTEAAPPVAAERPHTSRRVKTEPAEAPEPAQAAPEPVQAASESVQTPRRVKTEPAKASEPVQRSDPTKATSKVVKNTPTSTPQGHRDTNEAGVDDEEVIPLPMTKMNRIAVSASYWKMAEGRSKRAIEIAFGRITAGPKNPWHKDPVRKQRLRDAVMAALAKRETIMGAAQRFEMPYSTVHNNVKRTAQEIKNVSQADEEAVPQEITLKTAHATAPVLAAQADKTPNGILKRTTKMKPRDEVRDQPMSSHAAYAHLKQPKMIAFADEEEQDEVLLLPPPLKKVKQEVIDFEEHWKPIPVQPAGHEHPEEEAQPRIWRDENRTGKLMSFSKHGRCGLRGTEAQIRDRLVEVLKHGFKGDLNGMAEALMHWAFGTSLHLAATSNRFGVGDLLKSAQFVGQFVDLDDCELLEGAPRRGSRVA